MRYKQVLALTGAVLLLAAGCSREETEEERAERIRQARAESVAQAEAQYDASVFDTVTWESPEARLERGAVVWRSSCEKCHGGQGAGDGEMAVADSIGMPSFADADWAYAGNVSAIRHRIYVGHESEMPNWGLHGLKYRDVDAVAGYIAEVLRPVEPDTSEAQ